MCSQISKKKIIFFVATAGLIIYFIFGLQRNRKKISETLNDLFEFSDDLHSLEAKLEELVSKDDLALLLANNVTPAIAEVSEIRNLTTIYENGPISEIPGDFMHTSIVKLKVLMRKLFSWEKQYREITTRMGKQIGALHREIYKCNKKFDNVLKSAQLSLETLEIYLYPEDLSAKERETGLSILKILSIMKIQLLPFIQEFENIKTWNSQSPFFEKQDLENAELKKVLQNINLVRRDHSKNFEQIGPLLIRKLSQIKIGTRKTEKIEFSLLEYLHATADYERSILRLKSKINNLMNRTKVEEL